MRVRLIFIAVIISLLTGCIPAAFVAGATAGGAIVYDNRSFKTITQDKKAELSAQEQIGTDTEVGRNKTHVSVIVFNHVMLLVGQAATSDQAQRAYDLVSNTPNIKRIYNEITVQQPTSNLVRSQDSWITTKVKTKMLAEKGLHSTQIKVVTENGVVYLLGLVSHTQGNLAALVTSRVAGVKQVVKLFEYPN